MPKLVRILLQSKLLIRTPERNSSNRIRLPNVDILAIHTMRTECAKIAIIPKEEPRKRIFALTQTVSSMLKVSARIVTLASIISKRRHQCRFQSPSKSE